MNEALEVSSFRLIFPWEASIYQLTLLSENIRRFNKNHAASMQILNFLETNPLLICLWWIVIWSMDTISTLSLLSLTNYFFFLRPDFFYLSNASSKSYNYRFTVNFYHKRSRKKAKIWKTKQRHFKHSFYWNEMFSECPALVKIFYNVIFKKVRIYFLCQQTSFYFASSHVKPLE